MPAPHLALLVCVLQGLLNESMGALVTILYDKVLYDKVDFARRQQATRRILATRPAGYLLLTGHGKGPWVEAFRHMLEAADDEFDA